MLKTKNLSIKWPHIGKTEIHIIENRVKGTSINETWSYS